ncbi:hypothetical protein Taro_009813 [Colocasia esculenta]|uniref:Uncharacterized protein n=1 Tax=Colocasia esculenta TaxID=4460 RepID=A0A843U190_COLES|nr:hypothetical protein [Colocasia esculenta]
MEDFSPQFVVGVLWKPPIGGNHEFGLGLKSNGGLLGENLPYHGPLVNIFEFRSAYYRREQEDNDHAILRWVLWVKERGEWKDMRRTQIKYIIGLTDLDEAFHHSWYQSKKFEMADRRDWGGGGDDPEESTQRMIERIWESLTDIRARMDQQAPMPPVAVPPVVGRAVPEAPVLPPPEVEVPFAAPVPPLPPVLAVEEPVMQVEKFLRLQPPTYSGGPNPDTAEHWVHEIERVFATMRCPTADRVVLAAYQLRASEERAISDTPASHVDANLCDLQNISMPEDSTFTPFSLSLALFSCSCLPYYFQRLQKVNWRIVEREAVTNWPRKTPERGVIAVGARGGFGAKQENLGGTGVEDLGVNID